MIIELYLSFLADWRVELLLLLDESRRLLRR